MVYISLKIWVTGTLNNNGFTLSMAAQKQLLPILAVMAKNAMVAISSLPLPPKAIAADFGGNGKLDIATIAFFADMKNDPAESFIYFEQVSPFNFKPHAIPISKYGHWMTMDVADFNNDGKPDIILGNYGSGFM